MQQYRLPILLATLTGIVVPACLLGVVAIPQANGTPKFCLVLKRELTLKVFFQQPDGYSGEDGYMESIRAFPANSPTRLEAEDYKKYVATPSCEGDRWFICS